MTSISAGGTGRNATVAGAVLCAAAMAIVFLSWRMVEEARELALLAPERTGASAQLPALGDPAAGLSGALDARVVLPDAAESLVDYYELVDYRLDPVREGVAAVPRVFARELPQDLRDVPEIELRKRIFIRTILPLVLKANEEVRAQRRRLVENRQKIADGEAPASANARWFHVLAEQYGLEDADLDLVGTERLLKRVDAVPPSLAIAQSIQESGWGTSRFASGGNALFGQRTWRDEQAGLQPTGVSDDAGFRVRAYPNLLAGIRSYLRNLNTHRSYAELRARRAAAQAESKRLDGYQLAGTLLRYSEEGEAYVRKLRGLIRSNELRALDDATLDPHSVARELAFDPNVDEVQISYGTRN
ncbi:MAG: glucosaminidase domain-containing protein [Rhodovibrionaceae bacterium]|nr:glucosaminidase domain-containing protein [Rhodovibrionaceae bacterium]